MADMAHRRIRHSWSLLLAALLSVATVGAFVAVAVWSFVRPRGPEIEAKSIAVPIETKPQENAQSAFEPTDWALRPVALIYIAIPLLLVVSSFVVIAAYPTSLPDVGRTVRIAPPGPRLQTDAQGDLRRFRAEQEKRLNSYYWVDKQKGTVHIPIDQAMKKLAADGIPGFPKARQ